MKLTLPQKLNAAQAVTLDTKVLVVIGANGTGKSSFGQDILNRYPDRPKRFRAFMPCSLVATRLHLKSDRSCSTCNR